MFIYFVVEDRKSRNDSPLLRFSVSSSSAPGYHFYYEALLTIVAWRLGEFACLLTK